MSASENTPSLSDILRDHPKPPSTEPLRKQAVRDINHLCDATTGALSEKLTLALDNQRQIEQLSRQCAQLVQSHIQDTHRWSRLVDDFNNELKELGDVKNWAQVIERDMLDIAATLELVHSSLNPPINKDNTNQS